MRTPITLSLFAASVPLLVASSPEQPERPGKRETERVTPGLVAWHPSRAAAQDAAQASGKPVLLFQMLGRMDEEFC